jgi:predicted AAA+ superfamily ATPase
MMLENLTYIELLRSGYRVEIGKIGVKEIDFIATKDQQRIYIQVSYLLSSENTIQREFESLKSINDNFPKYVISMDKFNLSKDGIIHLNFETFLLQGLKQ